MKKYKREFIEFALQTQALLFGEFKLKSGRMSPYFFNAGCFNTGKTVSGLGKFYAQAIIDAQIPFDMLFGPAYKGIPLVTTVAVSLFEAHGMDRPFAFDRKEAKTHGEGGMIVGAPLHGNILLIDDVMTAGITVGKTIKMLSDAHCQITGIIISMDRQERTQQGDLSATDAVRKMYKIPVIPIISFNEVVQYLEESEIYHSYLERMRAYHHHFGAAEF